MTTSERKQLREKTGWSEEIVEAVGSVEEAEIYIRAGLKEARIGDRLALVRTDIDWQDYSVRRNTWLKQYLADYDSWAEYSNADLVGEGYPPRDRNGDPYELHHIGQRQDSPFAELTWAEHMGNGNNTVLHQAGKESEIDRPVFDNEKSEYWQLRYISLFK